MIKKNTLEQIEAFQKNTMTDHLGIKITDYGNNYICGKMPVDHRTKQPYGLLHGGASVAFAETLGSIGAGMQIDYNNQSVVGVEINASSMIPGTITIEDDGTITAKGFKTFDGLIHIHDHSLSNLILCN